MKNFLQNYPLTLLTLVAIFYLSFFTPPKIPELENVRFIDKWTHMVMYGGLTAVVLYEHFKQHGLQGFKLKTVQADTLHWPYISVIALWWPVALGGVIEILQEHCTDHRRSGEWLDFLADSLGTLLVFCIVFVLVKRQKK